MQNEHGRVQSAVRATINATHLLTGRQKVLRLAHKAAFNIFADM